MKATRRRVGGMLVVLGLASAVEGAPVFWTDWTAATANQVVGSLQVDGTPVAVTFDGPYAFAQTAGGTNYWTNPATYQSSVVDNAPPASDLIALGTGGTKLITFSAPVRDPLIAVTSWNGNTVDFGRPITLLSSGPGYWGNGTFVINQASTGFFGSGEVHGVIRVTGTVSQIAFTDTSEFWHGFTLGVVGLAETTGTAPEPGTLALLGLGLLGLVRLRASR